jgi:hypothetical protein
MKHRELNDLPGLHLMPSNVNLQRPEAVERWLRAAHAQLGAKPPALVVFDTLARNFVGGNESSPQDMGWFVEGVESVRRDLKTAVLVIHHSTKDGSSERGTESLRNASFAMFKFSDLNGRAVRVECDRMKDAEPPQARVVRPVQVVLPELTQEGAPEVSTLVANWPYSPGAKGEVPGESSGEISPADRRLLTVFDRANRRESGASPEELCHALKWGRTKLNVKKG